MHREQVHREQAEKSHVQATVSMKKSDSVLLATAMIGVLSKNGSKVMLHALLDQGSQSACIRETAAQTLGLTRKSISAVVFGIGAKAQNANHSIDLTIFPRFESDFVMQYEAMVLPEQTKCTYRDSDEYELDLVNNLTLADPSFLKDGEIDIILGASEYAQALKMGLIKTKENIIDRNSEFGWIISGAIFKNRSVTPSFKIVSLVTNVELNEQLKKLFDSDQFANDDSEAMTEEETMCEEHYQSTHYRKEDGQFVVKMPFKNGIEHRGLGNSKRIATLSLFSLERRFKSQPEMNIQYCKFINEYIMMNHMREVVTYESDANYLSHHCVFKESTTTKLRVVFNASQKTANKKRHWQLGQWIRSIWFQYCFVGVDIALLLRQILRKCTVKYF